MGVWPVCWAGWTPPGCRAAGWAAARELLRGSAAEEFRDRVAIFLGCFDAGYVTAAGKHNEPGSGDGGGDRLSLRGAADEVEFTGHDERRAGDAAQQWAQVH